jgi:hypothetical protein
VPGRGQTPRPGGGLAAAAIGLSLVFGTPAAGHWVGADDIVAQLNSEQSRSALGVEEARRDERTPRLLVVRVGERWYALPRAERKIRAAAWWDLWHHNVAGGIIAILDARTEKPVVQFGSRGQVTEVASQPRGVDGPGRPGTERPARKDQ